MNIGFYNESMNSIMRSYRGLYRCNNLIDICESNSLCVKKDIEWYFRASIEGNYLEYTDNNMKRLLQLYQKLKGQKWEGDLVLFTDKVKALAPMNFKFLGYDICADSRYYSPIGDGFLTEYNEGMLFFSEMNIAQYRTYRNSLNDNYLFTSYAVALQFSRYCSYINEKYEHSVESENNWRPFAIYSRTE